MAGHSKWANIQHRKKAQDSKRGKLFTKLIRNITVAARRGGEDPESNPWLRTAILKALGQNMTKDTIERAIKRGVGTDQDDMEEIRYEGYGPGGVAVLVDCLTDNRNRTVADVRHAFSKCGGNLGAEGSVSYLFNKKGLITFAPKIDENKLIEIVLEAGADDICTHTDGSIDVFSSPENYEIVHHAITAAGLEPEESDITMLPSIEVQLNKDNAEKMMKLIEMLEDLDDVQNVYSNADINEATLAQLEK
ncbi:MAG: YebC/PmpR family DNA-binding transcriptional regulator [Gammaproteobacteria bacterium]|nr:YebC/PmpR family DNA-binding transcriptional regulator [Gammaproteobacteria bacterium]